MIKVVAVHPESIGAEIGLEPGSEVLAVNDRELEDFLDWEFHTADDRFRLLARQPDGQTVEFDIERTEDLPMGVVLEPPRIRRCANRCDFCFVDGLAPGMRDVLYIRDDDYRLSFRYGNFATLTNLKQKDIARIIEYRLSPLYVSVHATDPVVRRYLLRNPDAPDVLEQLHEFARHGIQFHTQVVLSPQVNDGAVLEQTLHDLYQMGDPVLSVSVVPVGLTEYSKHSLVREPTDAECRAALELVRRRAAVARRERGITWAHGADELYLRAGVELPPASDYDGFEQVENGVGAVRYLEQRISEEAEAIGGWTGRRIGVFTGTSMGKLMPQLLRPLEAGNRSELRAPCPREHRVRRFRYHRGPPAGPGVLRGAPAGRATGPGAPTGRVGERRRRLHRRHVLRRCRRRQRDRSPAVQPLHRRALRGHGIVSKPTVAIVGRPNVGKSTLFNRILGGRPAIVSERPGTTRDRNFGEAEWQGRAFWLIDTGGLIPESRDQMDRAILAQVQLAVAQADLILLVVDGKEGLHPVDEEIAGLLRKLGRPVVVAVNKLDHLPDTTAHMDFYALGLGEPHAVSAAVGKASGDLLDVVAEQLPPVAPEEGEETIQVAVVGRPNVGKSSLVNCLLGEDRHVVAPEAGTTRDATDSVLRYHGKTLNFIDTAGLRKRTKVEDDIEFYSSLRTARALDRAQVTVLLVDATVGLHVQDLRIATMAWDRGAGLIVVVNKWDLVEDKEANTAERRTARHNGAGTVPGARALPLCVGPHRAARPKGAGPDPRGGRGS